MVWYQVVRVDEEVLGIGEHAAMLRYTYRFSCCICIAVRRRTYYHYVRMKWRVLQQISRATTAAPWPCIVPAATPFAAIAATQYRTLDLA